MLTRKLQLVTLSFFLGMMLSFLGVSNQVFAQGINPDIGPPPIDFTDEQIRQQANQAGIALGSIKIDCAAWTRNESAKPENKGKVCTDFIEGIPLKFLKETGNECYPPQGETRGKDNICFTLISGSGLGSFEGYVAVFYKYIGWIIGILGVLMIIVAGLEISFGGLAPEGVSAAKKKIAKILGGIALYFLIGVILRTINPTFFK